MANIKTFKTGIALDPQSADPSSPSEGQMQQSDGTSRAAGLWQYVGGVWQQAGGGAGDADTLHLIKAAAASDTDMTIKSIDDVLPDFDGSDTLTATFDVPTSGSNALLSEDDDHKVYRIATAASSQYDAVGRSFGIPRFARGRDILLEFQYRTADTSGASVDADYMVWIVDDTNMVNTTTTTTGSQVAGSTLTVGSTTGMSVGDKIWVGETGGTTQVTEAHITEVPSGTTLKISEDVNLSSGDRFVTGVLTDVLTTINAADDDTNKKGSSFKKYVLIPDDCADIKVIWQQLTSETDSFLYFDNILLSADPFKKIETQGMSESFQVPAQTNNFWDATGGSNDWDISLLTPNISTSKLITIIDDGGLTKIKALQDVFIEGKVDIAAGVQTSSIGFKDSSGNFLPGVHQVANVSYGAFGSVSVKLSKDDYIYAEATNNVNVFGGISLNVTPAKGTSHIVESADSVMSDWTDFTPVLTAFGTVSAESGRWRQIGDTMEVEAQFVSGTSTAVDGQIDLPLGYVLDNSKISGTGTMNSLGTYIRVAGTGTYYSSGNAGVLFADKSDNTSLYFTKPASSNANMEKTDGSAIASSGDGFAIRFSVPISGWSATNKPLIAIPTVTVGQNAEQFHATDWAGYGSTNTAVAYFSNEHVNTISNVGTITNDSTSGVVFTATQRCKVDISHTNSFAAAAFIGISKNATLTTALQSLPEANVLAITYESSDFNNPKTTSASVILDAGEYIAAHLSTGETGGSALYQGFTLVATPEIGQQNMAAIISQPVAYVKHVEAAGTDGGSATATTLMSRTLNTLEGDIAEVGVTLSSNQFTLPAGKYEVDGWSEGYQVQHQQAFLYNETDSVYALEGTSSYANNSAPAKFSGVVTITKSTTFSVKHYTYAVKATSGLGIHSNYTNNPHSKNEYAVVKITRKK